MQDLCEYEQRKHRVRDTNSGSCSHKAAITAIVYKQMEKCRIAPVHFFLLFVCWWFGLFRSSTLLLYAHSLHNIFFHGHNFSF